MANHRPRPTSDAFREVYLKNSEPCFQAIARTIWKHVSLTETEEFANLEPV